MTIPADKPLTRVLLDDDDLVDGKRVEIASYRRVEKGQVVSVRERSKTLTAVASGFAVADTFQSENSARASERRRWLIPAAEGVSPSPRR